MNKKIVGKFFQSERIANYMGENPIHLNNVYFEKVNFNPVVSIPILHKKAKITDLISCVNAGGNLHLIMSERLKKIIEKYREKGMQFFKTSIIKDDLEYDNYFSINMYESNNESIDFSDLGGYSDLMFVFDQVTASAAGIRTIQVSVDNGVSFFSASGDYQVLPASGLPAAATSMLLHTLTATAARTAVGFIRGNVAGYSKIFERPQRPDPGQLVASTAVIDAIRFANSSGNLTGGTVHLLGRP